MKKSKSKSKKNVRPGFLVFMAALVLGTMGIVLYLIRGGGGRGGKSYVKCGGTTPGSCDPGFDCTFDQTGYKCVAQSCTNNPNLCQNGSNCSTDDGKCRCIGQFTGPFCEQEIQKKNCTTDTCKSPGCLIKHQYTEKKGFSPGTELASAGKCVNLKHSVGGTVVACDGSKECLE